MNRYLPVYRMGIRAVATYHRLEVMLSATLVCDRRTPARTVGLMLPIAEVIADTTVVAGGEPGVAAARVPALVP